MFSVIKRLLDRKPDTASFASIVISEFQRARPDITFTFEPDKFLIRRSDNGVINLHNLYRDYCQADRPARRDQLERFVKGMLGGEKPEDFSSARSRLLPVMRHLAGVDLARIDAGDLSKRLDEVMTWKPFSQTLGVAVAVDSEHAIAQVGSPDLEAWGVTLEQALEIAIDNLRHKAAPAFFQISPGLYVSQYNDFYDAARILLNELPWQLQLSGDPVAMIPNRTCLLICGANDSAALTDMVARARQVLEEQSRPLSSEMFRLEGKSWVVWTPPGEAGKLLAPLQREIRASDYADQQRALESAHEKAGIDMFVAQHTLVQRQSDSTLLSYAVLPKDVDTWLPQADLIVLSEEPKGASIIVHWADFIELASHLLERLPTALPRFHVRSFPEGECLQRLREKATSFDTAAV